MDPTIACFGELLVRLSAPGRQRLLQSPVLEVHVGGAEANVAVALARLGHPTRLISVVPNNSLAAAAVAELRKHAVDTSFVRTGPGRMGLYFLVPGAIQRPSQVLYDRAESAFALASPSDYDWDACLAGAHRLHLSGVTPALGADAATCAIEAAKHARARGIKVSFDGNYRGKLWAQWQGDAATLLGQLIEHADIVFADHRDMEIVLARRFTAATAVERFAAAAEAAFSAFPNLNRFCATLRKQRTVDHHRLAAVMATRDGSLHQTAHYELTPIVDRIGAGDAFAAGVLHGLTANLGDLPSLQYGLAAACLKHSVPGDFNLVDAEEIDTFLADQGFDVRR